MPALTGLAVDEGPHSMDGLLLHVRDEAVHVQAFVGRRVIDRWLDPVEPYGPHASLTRAQCNALGQRNLARIARVVAHKYQLGAALNRQYPFMDILLSDITDSGEMLDLGNFAC
jgi:hypothetical protein